MKFSEYHKYLHMVSKLIVAVSVAFGCVSPAFSSEAVIRYFPCDVRSYEALFTTTRVNHLYHQMTLRL